MINKKSISHSDKFVKLKEMVKQHKVCWEVGPEYYIDSEKNTIQIGFTLYKLVSLYISTEPITIQKKFRYQDVMNAGKYTKILRVLLDGSYQKKKQIVDIKY